MDHPLCLFDFALRWFQIHWCHHSGRLLQDWSLLIFQDHSCRAWLLVSQMGWYQISLACKKRNNVEYLTHTKGNYCTNLCQSCLMLELINDLNNRMRTTVLTCWLVQDTSGKLFFLGFQIHRNSWKPQRNLCELSQIHLHEDAFFLHILYKYIGEKFCNLMPITINFKFLKKGEFFF